MFSGRACGRFLFHAITLSVITIHSVFAQPTPTPFLGKSQNDLPWTLDLGIGYGKYQNMQSGQGDTPLAKIGIGKIFYHLTRFQAGIEAAFQTGDDAHINASTELLEALGGLDIMTHFKPTLDLLLTGKFYPELNSPLYLIFKGGCILRRWDFDRGSINDLTRVYPELQLGGGVDISPSASLSLSYQHIGGGAPDLRLVSTGGAARVSNIPIENALLLDLTLSLL